MTQVLFNSAVRRLETCLLQIDDDCVSFYFATLLASTKSSKVTAYYRSDFDANCAQISSSRERLDRIH